MKDWAMWPTWKIFILVFALYFSYMGVVVGIVVLCTLIFGAP